MKSKEADEVFENLKKSKDKNERKEKYNQLLEDRALLYLQAQQQAKDYNLPVLKGSKKQIMWAECIRMSKIEELSKRLNLKILIASERESLGKSCVLDVINEENAKWWIEHRLLKLIDIIKDDWRLAKDLPTNCVIFNQDINQLGEDEEC